MVQKRPIGKHRTLRKFLASTRWLAFAPILTLGAFWAGGEAFLIAAAITIPAAAVSIGTFRERSHAYSREDETTGLMLRDALIDWVDRAVAEAAELDLQVAVIVATIDDLDRLE